MTLTERIDADFNVAMKEQREPDRSALRMIRSTLKNKQIDVGHALTDEEALVVLKTLKKQYEDALTDFENAGREDLVAKQTAEIELLATYLPAAMPADELEKIVSDAMNESGATGTQDTGKAMGAAMKAVAGRADGNAVREIVQRLLAPSG